MAKPNLIRCVNKTTNKVRYFSSTVANDPLWRKHTGFEIQHVPHDIQGFELGGQTPIVRDRINLLTEQPKVDIEAEIERRVAERLADLKPMSDIIVEGKKIESKLKRKYTKKQPA